MKKRIALISTLGLLALSVHAQNKSVATVNGKAIDFQDFDQAFKQSKMFVTHKKVTPETVLDDLINRELGIQKALKIKLDQDPTVKRKMLDVLYHAMVSKDLEPEFKKINITENDVKKYYQEYPEYRTAHILFRTRAIPSQPEAEEALKQAWKVYNTLQADPNKFAELANKFSQTSVANMGGDLGFQPAIKLAKSYFDAIKGLAPGTITKPVVSPFGVHIIKVLAVKDFKDIDYPLYQKIIYDQRRDAAIAHYFEKLRKGASIQIDKSLLK